MVETTWLSYLMVLFLLHCLLFQESHKVVYWDLYYFLFMLTIFLHVSITPMHLFMFADDIKYLKSVESIYNVAHIQCDTDSLFDWSRKWSLKFNHSKRVHMHFSQLLSSKSFTFYLDGTPIQLHHNVGIILSFGFELDCPLLYLIQICRFFQSTLVSYICF